MALSFSVDFLVDIRSLRHRYNTSVPILVHCSAGVGRSGVMVLVDMLMAKVDCGEVRDEGGREGCTGEYMEGTEVNCTMVAVLNPSTLQ